MKWIFTGLGGACVATGLVVYTQLAPGNPGPERSAIVPAALTSRDTASQPDPADSILVQAPTDSFTPEPVTKQPYTLEPLSPAISEWIDPDGYRERTDPPVQEWEAAARGEFYEDAAPPPAKEDETALSDTIFHGVKRLEIDIDVADVHILPSPNDELTLADPLTQAAVQQKGPVLKITTPKDFKKRLIRLGHDKVMEGQVLNIHVPRGTELILHTSAGQITIDEITGTTCDVSCEYGDIRIANSTLQTTANAASGDVKLENLYGAVDATVSFGKLELSHINGNISAHVASGDVRSTHTNGSSVIQCDFGNVELRNVRGEVDVHATSGNVTLDSIYANSCSVTSDFGNLDLTEIYANTHLIANSGNVVLQALAGNLAIESTFGDITATNIKGELNLVASSGSTTIRDLEGNLIAHVDFGDLKVQNSKGNASLAVASGSIETKNMELTDSLDIAIDFGDGEIGLKNKSDELRFDVESTFGKVKINKGDMKLEKENGAVSGGTGRIAVRGTTSSGSLTFN